MKLHDSVKHADEVKPDHDNFNHKLAMKLGDTLGAMGFFYFCVILDLAELPAVIQAHNIIAWITYVAQTVIQLIALPILQVYQNLQSEHNAAKAEVDHEALTYLAHLQDEQLEILKYLRDTTIPKGTK